MWSLQFDADAVKQLQEEMILIYSRLLNALKEYETEKEYLSGVWKGESASGFQNIQSQTMQKIKTCADKTEELLLSLEDAENIFRQCEKKVEKLIGEMCIWEI